MSRLGQPLRHGRRRRPPRHPRRRPGGTRTRPLRRARHAALRRRTIRRARRHDIRHAHVQPRRIGGRDVRQRNTLRGAPGARALHRQRLVHPRLGPRALSHKPQQPNIRIVAHLRRRDGHSHPQRRLRFHGCGERPLHSHRHRGVRPRAALHGPLARKPPHRGLRRGHRPCSCSPTWASG